MIGTSLAADSSISTLSLLAIVEAATVTGPAKNLLDFCRAAHSGRLPIKVHIATFSRGTGSNEFMDAVRAASVDLSVIPERRSFDFGVAGAIAELTRRLRPDILQTHAVKSHFLVAASRPKAGPPWIAFHHGYTTTDFKMRLYNQLDRWSLRKPVRLVTVSRAFERQLIARGIHPARITVLQNAVTYGWAERVRESGGALLKARLGFSAHEKVILAVGRMSVEKAHNDLIRAFLLLRSELPNTRLVLVGDGPERPRLEELAAGNVTFAGQTADVSPYYGIADVMALPSLTEGSPNVLLEAMACGVPCVATSVGGIPEIVADGQSALLVPARDPQKLSSALSRVLTDHNLREGLTRCSLDLIARKHSVEARAQALLEIYDSVAIR